MYCSHHGSATQIEDEYTLRNKNPFDTGLNLCSLASNPCKDGYGREGLMAAFICYVFRSNADERYAAAATSATCFVGTRPAGQRERAAAEVCRQSGRLQTRSSPHCSRFRYDVRCPGSLCRESVLVSNSLVLSPLVLQGLGPRREKTFLGATARQFQ